MSNRVHPTAIIGPDVILGEGNVIGPGAVLLGPTTIGNSNWIGPHACLGTPAQMRGGEHHAPWDESSSSRGISVGSGNVFREFVTVQMPTTGRTKVGDNGFFMTQVHIPHDAVVEDNVTMANSAHLGGHTHIGQGATLGLGALVHQGSRIGRLAMIGMGSVITKDIPPFAMAFGSPARVRGVNRVGMQRAGYPDEVIDALAAVYAEGVPTAPDQVPAVLSAEFARFFAAAASSER